MPVSKAAASTREYTGWGGLASPALRSERQLPAPA